MGELARSGGTNSTKLPKNNQVLKGLIETRDSRGIPEINISNKVQTAKVI